MGFPVWPVNHFDRRSVPGGIRTPNLLIRSQLLYPVELQTPRAVGRGDRIAGAGAGRKAAPHTVSGFAARRTLKPCASIKVEVDVNA